MPWLTERIMIEAFLAGYILIVAGPTIIDQLKPIEGEIPKVGCNAEGLAKMFRDGYDDDVIRAICKLNEVEK